MHPRQRLVLSFAVVTFTLAPAIASAVEPSPASGSSFNTGITGGMHGINNKVPPPPARPPAYNTGITGGITGINNKVPPPAVRPVSPWSVRGLFQRFSTFLHARRAAPPPR